MRRWIWAGLLAAAALGLGAAARPAAKGPVARLTPSACAADVSQSGRRIDCFTLIVPEARGTSSRRMVAMPVAIVRAAHPKPGLPPVIYLHGGPGGGAVGGMARRLSGVAGSELIAQDQDWIYFDQRGGALSVPNLDCGELALTDAGPLSEGTAQALIACGQRQKAAGVDLSRYNAEEIVKDIQDLRRLLGLKQVDLFGVSYGTRIALAVLAHDPRGMRAVVLDSPWPPEAEWADGGPQLVSEAVKGIFARCAADSACAARYPTVQRDLDALATSLLAGPVIRGGRRYAAEDLGNFLMDQTYSGPGARALPRDVARLAAGDFTPLDENIADRSGYIEGQHMSHLCKEEFPFETAAGVRKGVEGDPVSQLLARSMARYFEVCAAFPVGRADPAEARPVVSKVPTLWLAAEIDPGCPPQFAQAAARRFSRGQMVVIPNTTHGVSGGSACARRMIRAFLTDPLKPVDPGCLHPEHDRFVFTLE
jgi:pimeloyl-ACP methyl ester carboxylesterase